MTQATKTSAGRAARGLSPAMPGTATFTRRQRRRNLLIHLRKPEQAGYLTSEKTGNGAASRTTLALTRQSRTALASCTAALRDLPGGL